MSTATLRFNALIAPLPANIVVPPNIATRIKASIRCLPIEGLVLGLRKLGDVIACIP